MIAEYDPSENTFVLWTGLHETDLVKKVPGTSWKEWRRNPAGGNPGAWICPATWPAYVAINGLFSYALQPAESYTGWGQHMWTTRYEGLTKARFAPDAAVGSGPTVDRLWPLQRAAVLTLVWAERYLELDEMGGGKTATTLAAMKYAVALHGEAEVFPAIVVCPNKVRRTWRNIAHVDMGQEKGPLWPELRLEVMPKGKAAQTKVLAKFTDPDIPVGERPQVLVINWEALKNLSRLEKFGMHEQPDKEKIPGPLNEIDWRTFVADEAHRARDRHSQQTRAAKAIAFGTLKCNTRPSRFRWGLTGTLVDKDAAEAWSILNLIDEVAFPAYSRFVERYATQVYNGFGGMEIGGVKPETAEEFQAAFLPFSIRRVREQFDPYKPKVSFQTLVAPMEPRQEKAYNDLAKDMISALDGGVLTATDAMHKSNRLHQLAQSFGEMVDKGRRDAITGETILDLILKAPSNKVTAMLELVEELGITARGGPGRSIVFGASSRMLIGLCEEALKKKHIPYTLVVGGMSDAEQERQERAFELGTTRVALCTISAAKEGLNSLIRADTLVRLQRSWLQLENKQFQARIDRPGQMAGSVTIIDVVSAGTLEEFDQIEKLESKYANFQDVVSDARVLQTMLQFKGGAL